IAGSRFVVQGFGNVGSNAARFIAERGGTAIAVSNVDGGCFADDGLDIAALLAHLRTGATINEFRGASAISNEELLATPCDVLVPAALEDVFDATSAARVQAHLIVEGANGPTMPDGDRVFRERGIPVVPDILANA